MGSDRAFYTALGFGLSIRKIGSDKHFIHFLVLGYESYEMGSDKHFIRAVASHARVDFASIAIRADCLPGSFTFVVWLSCVRLISQIPPRFPSDSSQIPCRFLPDSPSDSSQIPPRFPWAFAGRLRSYVEFPFNSPHLTAKSVGGVHKKLPAIKWICFF